MRAGSLGNLLITALLLTAGIFGNLYAQENTAPAASAEMAENVPLYPFNIQPLPGLNIFGRPFQKTTNIFLFGFVVGVGHNIKGMGTATFGLVNTGDVDGIQLSGVFNTISGDLRGVQTASLFNIVSGTPMGLQLSGHFNWAKNDARGVQAAALFNNASGTLMGVQLAGLFNYAKEIRGIQVGAINKTKSGYGLQVGLINVSDSDFIIPIGLINFVREGMKHPAIYVDDMLFLNAGYRSGGKYFYSHSNFGLSKGLLSGREGEKFFVYRSGHGVEIPIKRFFVNLEFSTGNIINLDSPLGPSTRIYQIRTSGGVNILEHLGVFAGVSLDYLSRKNGDSPDPAVFGPGLAGKTVGNNTYKFGLFGGLQY